VSTLARLDSTLDAVLASPRLLRTHGAFLRTPDGNAETVASDMGSDIGWLALNVGDGHSWEEWRQTRDIAARNGVSVYPWERCHDESYLRHLLELAEIHAVQPLPNLEQELDDGTLPAARVGKVCAEYPVTVVGWSLVAWLYADVDFLPLTDRPALLQVFPADNRWTPEELPAKQRDCIRHARRKGFLHVGVTHQTYAGAEPEWYAYHRGPRSLFTGDDMGTGNWARWRPD
jgi:hypothetical protein